MPRAGATTSKSSRDVVVFLTGGTIGMRRRADGPGVAPGGGLDELFESLLPVEGVRVRTVEWSDRPSPHMTPEDMLRLARDIDAALAERGVCGAVVLHGTDLLAETSFLLDIALASTKPVVTTGSMRHMEEAGYDGQRNLLNSILACLTMPRSSEVLVQIADHLYTARDAIKLDSVSVDPLIGQRRGSVGRIAGSAVELTQDVRVKRPRLPFPVTGLARRVPLVTCSPGMGGEMLEAVSRGFGAGGLNGLVLEGFGAGNVPPGLVPAIRRLRAREIPVVLATRCVKGGVWPIYGYEGGAAQLVTLGVIPAGPLSGIKAQLLLKAALGSGCPPGDLEKVFR